LAFMSAAPTAKPRNCSLIARSFAPNFFSEAGPRFAHSQSRLE
jgi:hypothetical protein